MRKARSVSLHRLFRFGHRRLGGGAALVGGALILLGSVVADSHAQTLTTLASFNGSNGQRPGGGLTLVGSQLYGMTQEGGDYGKGVVYSIPVSGGTPTVLASLDGNYLYNWSVSLVNSGNMLYGIENNGVVFSLPTSGGTPAVLASLSSGDGTAPTSLVLSGSRLYGTAQRGGPSGYDGTVFSLPVSGGNPTLLTSFNFTDGGWPGSLTLIGNTLYGTAGLSNGSQGEVFSLPISGGNPTVLGTFNGTNGYDPTGVTLVGGTLYGTTELRGAYNNDGEVFSLPASGGTPTVLGSFNGNDGQTPIGALTLVGSTFYGTTAAGGANGGGVIFSVPISGGDPTALVSFDGSDGWDSYGNLMVSGNTLYGVTSQGGSGYVYQGFTGYGTVFALALPASAWSKSGGGSWNTPGNWSSGTVPNGAGVQAILGSALTLSSTITLDGARTVGSLIFNDGSAGYTLSAGSGGMLTLNNAGAASQIVVLAGTHSITAPVEIADGNLTVSESGRGRLLISGNISDDNGAESLTVNGDGSGILVLSGKNTYGGGTIVEDGRLVVTNSESLPDGSSLIVGNASFFPSYSPITPARAATSVPEPSTLALLGAGALALGRTWQTRKCSLRKNRVIF